MHLVPPSSVWGMKVETLVPLVEASVQNHLEPYLIIIQITKVFVAFIFTLIAIGSLASISNSIFSGKILNELNSKSSDQISRLKLELTTTVKSLEFNKKSL